MTLLLAAVRAIHFASLMAIFGGASYAMLLQRSRLGERLEGTGSLFMIAASLALVSGIVWFCLIAGRMSGSWEGALDPSIVKLAATSTRFGHIFSGRFIGLAALWLICTFRIGSNRLGISILAGLLLASLGPISHSAASGSDIVSIGAISDAAHLLTAGVWLGGLIVLAMFLKPHRGDVTSMLRGLRLFSICGTPTVAILVVSGLINAILILPVSEMSVHNSYFDLLLLKVGLASAMIILAALNRCRFTPALGKGEEGAARHLATSVTGEIVLGLTVLATAGLLGMMAPQPMS